jgi:hypothetical protein
MKKSITPIVSVLVMIFVLFALNDSNSRILTVKHLDLHNNSPSKVYNFPLVSNSPSQLKKWRETYICKIEGIVHHEFDMGEYEKDHPRDLVVRNKITRGGERSVEIWCKEEDPIKKYFQTETTKTIE